MFRPRVIPVLLLKNSGLVKSVKFKNYKYIGDPINSVKIFNDLKADELVFLDIDASIENRIPDLDLIKKIGAEANMPFAVGGGIKKLDEIKNILKAGAEKVILNTHAFLNPNLIKTASNEFGSSTVTVSIDVKKSLFFGKKIYIYSGKKLTFKNPVDYAKFVEDMGAGEIIINSIDRDGSRKGYDLNLVFDISSNVSIPVVALGGAKDNQDFFNAINSGKASAVAAGSKFVFHGPRNAVLINYPNLNEKKSFLSFEKK